MSKPIILTVDDEPQVLHAVERDLRRRYGGDYRIVKAISGAEALDTVRHLKGLATDLRDREGRLLVKLRVNLNKILEEAMLDVRPDLAGGVEVFLDAAELPAIWGDGFLLRRAFACAVASYSFTWLS